MWFGFYACPAQQEFPKWLRLVSEEAELWRERV